MDTSLIKQYGEEILSYRLRTARQKQRMQYEDFDKQLIQLDKKRRELSMKKWNLGWEPLIPPVQKGWKRFFVLRDDVSRGKQAEFFQNILDKINTNGWSHRRDFMVKRRKFGRKIYVVKPQRLLEPEEHHFKKLCFTETEHLMNPDFIELLIDNPNTVLIIEDAENIIMDRKYNSSSAVSNLLNISDGLLADFLNVQLICTFNSALTTIDNALLRKGRLIARYEFGKLGIAKAQRLSQHFGFTHTISRPMTIAEIANPHEKQQEAKQIQVIGFRRGYEPVN